MEAKIRLDLRVCLAAAVTRDIKGTCRELIETSASTQILCFNVVKGNIPACNFNMSERVCRP